MLPVDLVEKLNHCAANDFMGPRDHWFNWLAGFTTAVFIGLVFELPELAYELKLIAREWIPYFRYRILTPSEHRLHAAKVVAFIGWLLIVIGVGGERYSEVRVKDLDANIQECADAKVRAATLEAGDAATSATTAHDEADAAKADSATAKRDSREAVAKAHSAEDSLAKAEADAGRAQTAAANALATATDAGARAAKAEASLGRAEAEAKNAETAASDAVKLAQEARRDAATFESDLKRLKKQAEDRVLDEFQQAEVARQIQPFLGTPYELAVADTPEAEKLLSEIDSAVGSAGWLYKPSENKGLRFTKTFPNGHVVEPASSIKGVEIGVSPLLFERLRPASEALAKALNSVGISAHLAKLRESDPSPNSIHIAVGIKP